MPGQEWIQICLIHLVEGFHQADPIRNMADLAAGLSCYLFLEPRSQGLRATFEILELYEVQQVTLLFQPVMVLVRVVFLGIFKSLLMKAKLLMDFHYHLLDLADPDQLRIL